MVAGGLLVGAVEIDRLLWGIPWYDGRVPSSKMSSLESDTRFWLIAEPTLPPHEHTVRTSTIPHPLVVVTYSQNRLTSVEVAIAIAIAPLAFVRVFKAPVGIGVGHGDR